MTKAIEDIVDDTIRQWGGDVPISVMAQETAKAIFADLERYWDNEVRFAENLSDEEIKKRIKRLEKFEGAMQKNEVELLKGELDYRKLKKKWGVE